MRGLALCLVAGVQPARPVARAATSLSIVPCARARLALFPIVSVDGASIDADASLTRDCLCTLTIDEV